jgi:hypothetical protein
MYHPSYFPIHTTTTSSTNPGYNNGGVAAEEQQEDEQMLYLLMEQQQQQQRQQEAAHFAAVPSSYYSQDQQQFYNPHQYVPQQQQQQQQLLFNGHQPATQLTYVDGAQLVATATSPAANEQDSFAIFQRMEEMKRFMANQDPRQQQGQYYPSSISALNQSLNTTNQQQGGQMLLEEAQRLRELEEITDAEEMRQIELFEKISQRKLRDDFESEIQEYMNNPYTSNSTATIARRGRALPPRNHYTSTRSIDMRKLDISRQQTSNQLLPMRRSQSVGRIMGGVAGNHHGIGHYGAMRAMTTTTRQEEEEDDDDEYRDEQRGSREDYSSRRYTSEDEHRTRNSSGSSSAPRNTKKERRSSRRKDEEEERNHSRTTTTTTRRSQSQSAVSRSSRSYSRGGGRDRHSRRQSSSTGKSRGNSRSKHDSSRRGNDSHHHHDGRGRKHHKNNQMTTKTRGHHSKSRSKYDIPSSEDDDESWNKIRSPGEVIEGLWEEDGWLTQATDVVKGTFNMLLFDKDPDEITSDDDDGLESDFSDYDAKRGRYSRKR